MRWLPMLAVLLVGCVSTPEPVIIYRTTPLPMPERPVLPVVDPEELGCLSDEAYERLLMREQLRRNYAEQLETIIRATHALEAE